MFGLASIPGFLALVVDCIVIWQIRRLCKIVEQNQASITGTIQKVQLQNLKDDVSELKRTLNQVKKEYLDFFRARQNNRPPFALHL